MKDIRTWLNGPRDYTTGATLYATHGGDAQLKRMFAEQHSPFKQQRLESALLALLSTTAAAATVAVLQVADKAQSAAKEISTPQEQVEDLQTERRGLKEDIEYFQDEAETLQEVVEDLSDEVAELKAKTGTNGWPVVMDAALTALHADWRLDFITRCDLQSKLEAVARAGLKDAEKRKEAGRMALRILDLQEQINRHYTDREHYLSLGTMPAAPAAEICLDPVLYKSRYDNAMKYARTYRKKLLVLEPGSDGYNDAQALLLKWEGEAETYRKLLKKD